MSSNKNANPPTLATLNAARFGEALGRFCNSDPAFSFHMQIGFTRTQGNGKPTGTLADVVIALQQKAVLDQMTATILASSASTNASTSKRSLEKGKRSKATRKTTRSRRVMPPVSATKPKSLRKKNAPGVDSGSPA